MLATARPIPPRLWRLLAAETLLHCSQTAGAVGLAWWIVATGNMQDIAFSAAVVAGVSLVATPLAGPLLDKHAKSTLLRFALLGQAVVGAMLAAMAHQGTYVLPIILLLRAALTIFAAAASPALVTLLPEIVGRDQLGKAMSLHQSAQSAGRILGLAVGGSMTSLGVDIALLLQSLLLLASSALTIMLPSAPSGGSVTFTQWWDDLRSGARASWRVPTERGWVFVNLGAWMFLFPAMSILIPQKVWQLGLSGAWLGAWEVAIALGALAGASTLGPTLISWAGRYRSRLGAALLQGAGLVAVGCLEDPVATAFALAVVGAANATLMLAGMTHRVLARPAPFRARMTTCVAAVTQLACMAGALVSSWWLPLLAVQDAYVVLGTLAAVASLCVVFVPGFRTLMEMEQSDVEGWYGRAHPEAFAGSSNQAHDQALRPK